MTTRRTVLVTLVAALAVAGVGNIVFWNSNQSDPGGTTPLLRPRVSPDDDTPVLGEPVVEDTTAGGYKDALDRIRNALTLTDPNRRLAHLREAIERMDVDQLAAAREVFDAYSHHAYPDAFDLYLDAFGKLDGAIAAAYALAIDGEFVSGRPLAAAVTGWASTDPEQATDWLGRFASHGFNPFTEALFAGWVRGDPNGAFDAAAELTQGIEIERAMTAIVRHMFRGDRPGLLERLDSLPQPVRDAGLTAYLDLLSRDDPGEAAAVLERSENLVVTDATLSAIVRTFGTHAGSIEPASTWVLAQRETPRWGQAVEALVATHGGTHPGAVAHWMNSLAPADVPDRAVERFVAVAAPADPEGVASWAAGIHDAALRTASVQNAVLVWMEHDAPSADAWLEERGWTDLFSGDPLPPEAAR